MTLKASRLALLIPLTVLAFINEPLALQYFGCQDSGMKGAVKTVVEKDLFLLACQYTPSGKPSEYRIDVRGATKPAKAPVRYVFLYNDHDNLSKVLTYGRDGSLLEQTTYSYDDWGQQRAEISSSETGVFFGARFLDYDDKGHVIRELFYAGDEFDQKLTHVYDAKGNRVKSIVSGSEAGSEFAESFLHDSIGQVVETQGLALGKTLITRNILKYDGKGNPIEQTAYSPDGTVINRAETIYEYDSRGNWIKRSSKSITYSGDEAPKESRRITERTISYYP